MLPRSLDCSVRVRRVWVPLIGAWATLGLSGTAAGRELVEVSLIAETESVRPGEPFWVGIHLEMADGWHVNWINPGDAGLPPSVEWHLPDGLTASEIHWPYPGRFDIPELAIFGYEDEVLLLVRMTPSKSLPTGELTIKGRVDWLACRKACVPGSTEVTLAVRVADREPLKSSMWAKVFDQARLRLPIPADRWKVAAQLNGETLLLVFKGPDVGAGEIKGVAFYPATGGIIEHASPQVVSRRSGRYELTVELSRMRSEEPSRIRGVVVSPTGWGIGPQKALEIDVPVDDTGKSN